MCLEVQLRTYQPPIPKTSQASNLVLKVYRTLGCVTPRVPVPDENRITEYRMYKKPWQKMRFRASGSTVWSRKTDPDLVRLKMKPDFQRGSTTDHIADWNNVLLDAQWNKEGTKLVFEELIKEINF